MNWSSEGTGKLPLALSSWGFNPKGRSVYAISTLKVKPTATRRSIISDSGWEQYMLVTYQSLLMWPSWVRPISWQLIESRKPRGVTTSLAKKGLRETAPLKPPLKVHETHRRHTYLRVKVASSGGRWTANRSTKIGVTQAIVTANNDGPSARHFVSCCRRALTPPCPWHALALEVCLPSANHNCPWRHDFKKVKVIALGLIFLRFSIPIVGVNTYHFYPSIRSYLDIFLNKYLFCFYMHLIC